mgnify:CR=1 FL=1
MIHHHHDLHPLLLLYLSVCICLSHNHMIQRYYWSAWIQKWPKFFMLICPCTRSPSLASLFFFLYQVYSIFYNHSCISNFYTQSLLLHPRRLICSSIFLSGFVLFLVIAWFSITFLFGFCAVDVFLISVSHGFISINLEFGLFWSSISDCENFPCFDITRIPSLFSVASG